MVVWLSVDVNVTPTASYDAAADPMSIMVGGRRGCGKIFLAGESGEILIQPSFRASPLFGTALVLAQPPFHSAQPSFEIIFLAGE